MKWIITLIVLFSLTIKSQGQITFRVESDIYYPDFSVKIGDNVYYPDISIKIGKDVYYPDFTVGITSNKSQANFVITTSNYADYSIKASDDVYYPDLSIKAGNDVYYPDLTIKILTSGTVDYIVYTEKEFISLRDLVVALLPAINYHTDFEHDELNELFED